MAVEADESDGSFLKLRATVGIVTNIDPEHMEHYGDFDTLRAAFDQFVEGLPFYGFAVLCTDHPEVQSLASRIEDRRVITYGFNAQADVRCENLKMTPDGSRFDVVFRYGEGEAERWSDMFLPMMGEHNVLNTVAAITVARELGADEASAKRALEGFGGVKRRFTRTGEWNGATIIDDYGHHPVEITAVLKAARQAATRRVIAVAQPHRYTRLRDLFEDFCTCFNEADSVLIADVYGLRALTAITWSKVSRPMVTVMLHRQHARPWPAMSLHWPSRAISLSALAQATSPPGPMPCRMS